MKNNQNYFNLIKQLELVLEIEAEKKYLREVLEMSDIEIEGYFEMFADNYVDIRSLVDENC